MLGFALAATILLGGIASHLLDFATYANDE
jgi:hypothetical protein